MSVVAADGHPILLDGPGTVVAIIFIIRILSHILKGRNHFECRSRRILALCSTIQKHAVLISIQEIPILSYGIGIKVRLGDHGQDLSCARLHHHHGSLVIAEGIIGSLLKFQIQSGHHAIAHILLILEFILYLFQEKSIGSQKFKVLHRFQA